MVAHPCAARTSDLIRDSLAIVSLGGKTLMHIKWYGLNAQVLYLFSLIMLVSCADELKPLHSDFKIGMKRADILSTFGEPSSTQSMTKTTSHIFGPIEDFWYKVPDGAKIEIWSYDSYAVSYSDGREYRRAGQTELYFLNDSDEVDGIGFYDEGAVY
jgi:hypothetical protein